MDNQNNYFPKKTKIIRWEELNQANNDLINNDYNVINSDELLGTNNQQEKNQNNQNNSY